MSNIPSAMKALVKKILPRPALNAAVSLKGRAALSAHAPEQFNAAPLRALDAHALSALLNDPSAADSWARDHARIAAILGDDDRYGGVNPGDRRAIYTLVKTLKPRRVLEIGTHIGASTLHIAAALPDEGRVTSVDILDVNAPGGPWTRANLPGCPADNLAKLGLQDRAAFAAKPAQDYMRETPDRFDLVFLDGDHGAPAVYGEVARALRILNPNGLILLHDYYPGGRPLFPDGNLICGPYLALERVKRECPQIGVLPLGALPWPTKQGTNLTSLALLKKE